MDFIMRMLMNLQAILLMLRMNMEMAGCVISIMKSEMMEIEIMEMDEIHR